MSHKEKLNSIFLECYNSDILLSDVICPACESKISESKNHFLIKKSMWGDNNIVRIKCPECKTVFGPISLMNMKPESLEECYKLLYSFFKEGTGTLSQNDIFFSINPEKNKKYLNYGCGDWDFGLSKLLSLGFDVYGFDPVFKSKNTKIYNDKSKFNHKFDGLFSQNFIEHLQDPYEQFKEWNNMMELNSIMIHVGDYNYEESVTETNFHLIFLSEDGLKKICERTGFEFISKNNRKAIFKKIKQI